MPLSSRRLPRCLLACLVSSCLSFRLSVRRAGRLGDGRRLLAIAMVVRMPCGCRVAACSSVRSAPRPPIAPSCDTDGGEGNGASSLLLRSDFYHLLLSLAAEADLLACSYAVGRFRPAVCGARILWIAFVAVAGAASPWYIVNVS